VREPTDVSMPEVDIILEGGTGENEVMNGMYFKLTSTFGVPIFRMVKKHVEPGRIWDTITGTERFVFKDPVLKCWVVSDTTTGGVKIEPGNAFSDDQAADRPGDAVGGWYVWHTQSKTLKSQKEEILKLTGDEIGLAKLKENPIDEIKFHSIMGFEITRVPVGVSGPLAGIMVRQAGVYYGRPVYENETSTQFMYWTKKDGDLDEGFDEEWQNIDLVANAKKFFCEGYWAIAPRVGMLKDDPNNDPNFFAFLDDNCVTPWEIPSEKKWKVRKQGKDVDSDMKVKEVEMELKRQYVDPKDVSRDQGGDASATTPLLSG